MSGQTPSEVLSRIVAERLKEEGLLRPGKLEAFSTSLASGRLKGPDWKLEVELATAKDAQ